MSEVTIAPEFAAAKGVRTEHHHILIVGGGTAGISVAARLRRKLGGSSLAVVEPSDCVAILRLTVEGERRLARSFHAHATERKRLRAMVRRLAD
ncbi:MAG TPA: NAD(P)-binding protein [Gaiellaceae bacterium]